jgi:hypothetical protein
MRKQPPAPDLTIQIYNLKKMDSACAYIICKEMKCDMSTCDVGKTVNELAKEWLDLQEAYAE